MCEDDYLWVYVNPLGVILLRPRQQAKLFLAIELEEMTGTVTSIFETVFNFLLTFIDQSR